MAGVADSGNPACGHSVQPGSRFCPVCGQPAAGAAAPSQPPTAPLPVVPGWPQSTVPPSVSPAARDAASNIRRALQPIHEGDYFTARERALAWAGDLTRIIDHARTDITSLAWRV